MLDFDTLMGIAFISLLIQMNSPLTAMSARHARFNNHQVQLLGKPAYIQQHIKWNMWAVAAKSKHYKKIKNGTQYDTRYTDSIFHFPFIFTPKLKTVHQILNSPKVSQYLFLEKNKRI